MTSELNTPTNSAPTSGTSSCASNTAKRDPPSHSLAKKQNQRYGSQQSYRNYIATVTVLLPWVPLYALKHIRVWRE